MERRGQGAIEYLLIIGAAILVVAVVIIALTSVSSSAGDVTGGDDVNAALAPVKCQQACTADGGTWDSGTSKCSIAITDPAGYDCTAYEP